MGVIPARGGSKGVLEKNIRLLKGKPLLHYTVEAAQGSELLTGFVVSTESHRIADLCKSLGLEIPFMRPQELAEDHVESYPVVTHALGQMEKMNNIEYDYFIMLQPTTPLRTSKDIDQSLKLLFETGADSVVSVTDVGGIHPLRMKRILDDNKLINFIEQDCENMKPRQDLPPVYIRNGAIYASKCSIIYDLNSLVGDDCRAYLMPNERSLNIDTEMDFKIGEFVLGE